MNAPTILIALLVAAVFVAIILRGIANRKKGKSSCACGGDCGSCKGCH